MEPTRAAPTTQTCQGLVVLKFLPAGDLLDIVNEGFPFMAWLRSEPDASDWKDSTEASSGGQARNHSRVWRGMFARFAGSQQMSGESHVALG